MIWNYISNSFLSFVAPQINISKYNPRGARYFTIEEKNIKSTFSLKYFQLTFVDEVGSQLESLDLGRGGGGRQLVPGLLYIDNDNNGQQQQQQQKQISYKVGEYYFFNLLSYVLHYYL